MRLRHLLITLIALACIGAAGLFVLTMPARVQHETLKSYLPNLSNGETMFYAGGCAACHMTPEQEDHTRLGGGRPLQTPFGTFKPPNISPDPVHGIGAWTESEFATAMLRGVGRNGEYLYPAFPYTSYQRMALDDVRDLFAYLRTLPADARPSELHQLSFPFNVRRGLALWQLIYLDGKTFTPDPAKGAVLNRGAYLVEGPCHCAECHSLRNLIGSIPSGRRFAGGPNPAGKGYVPNITPHPDGLANWTQKDIEYLLETGFTPEYDSVGSSMAEVVENTAKLTAADRAAIATYIKALPPRPGKSSRNKP
jgi:mono/diheme cytochrome c family protein